MQVASSEVAGIPIVVVRPEPRAADGRLALWLHHFGGSAEAMAPILERIAERGLTAVSLDARQHGRRGTRAQEAMLPWLLADFRRVMWPILGGTLLDAVAVLDALAPELGPAGVVAGGLSMGGDVAVALAGVDRRVSRVAAVVATPDWTRPGMTPLDDPHTVLPQGEATGVGAVLRDAFDPSLHPRRFVRDLAVRFELGEADTHVPPAGAVAFQSAVAALDPDHERVQVRQHAGLDHLAAARAPETVGGAVAFLAGP